MAVAPAPAVQTTLSRRQVITVFVGLLTGLFLSALDSTIINTALPTIVAELGGLEHYAWVGTAYLLTSTVSTVLVGKLSDLYGRRTLFQAAIIAFVFGSVLCALSQTMVQLVLSRGVQGIGGGGLMAMAFVVVGDIVAPRERGRYVGAFTAVFAIASVIGPLLGGFLVDRASWPWIFWINVPLGIVALIVVSRSLHLPFTRTRRQIDFLGAALLIGSVGSLILVTSWGGREYEWGSPVIVGLALAAVLLAVAFVAWEGRAPEPILPRRLFRLRVVSTSLIVSVLLGSIMFGSSTFMPLFLQAVTGVSATVSGLLLLPMMAGILVSSTTAGRMIAATGRYKRFILSGLVTSAIGLAILTTIEPDQSRLVSSTGLLVLGLGMGMVMPVLTVVVQNAVPPADLGVGSSAVQFFRSLGGAVGLAAYGALFADRLAEELPRRIPAGANFDPALIEDRQVVQALPPDVKAGVLDALSNSIAAVYVVAAAMMVLATIVAVFIDELPLRSTSALDERRADAAATAH